MSLAGREAVQTKLEGAGKQVQAIQEEKKAQKTLTNQ